MNSPVAWILLLVGSTIPTFGNSSSSCESHLPSHSQAENITRTLLGLVFLRDELDCCFFNNFLTCMSEKTDSLCYSAVSEYVKNSELHFVHQYLDVCPIERKVTPQCLAISNPLFLVSWSVIVVFILILLVFACCCSCCCCCRNRKRERSYSDLSCSLPEKVQMITLPPRYDQVSYYRNEAFGNL